MATIHPYKGYLNTEFHLYAKGTENVTYNIFSDVSEAKTPLTSGVTMFFKIKRIRNISD